MYFHLIGIKEKNGKKYDLDLLLRGGDEDFIRKFLANRGVVIVSIMEYKEDPNTFGNIIIEDVYDETNVNLIIKGDDIPTTAHFIIFLGINPVRINFIENPIPEDQMKDIIASAQSEIQEENEKIKKEKELEEFKEQQKYQELGIKDGLKIINSNIDHIEQLIKAGEGIISGTELKQLEDYLNEMKKIRLGTNFNKMASLVLDAQSLIKATEKQIIDANISHTFLINENSVVSNIDVLHDYFSLNSILYRAKFQPSGLKTSESIASILGTNAIYLNLLRRDASNVLSTTSMEEIVRITMNVIEYIVLTAIIAVSLMWLFAPLFGKEGISLYLLPAFGRLGLLLYLFNNLELKGLITKFLGFFVLVIVYRYGLVLLLNTFAL